MRLVLAVLLLTSLSVSAQDARPNFTGTYELDRAKSQDGAARTLSVQHHEPNLRYTSQGRNRSQEFNLTINGSDQLRDEPKGESRISARWDGPVLEIRSFLKSAENETTIVERWSAEPAGMLTIQTRSSRKPSGAGSTAQEREFRLVFRKKG